MQTQNNQTWSNIYNWIFDQLFSKKCIFYEFPYWDAFTIQYILPFLSAAGFSLILLISFVLPSTQQSLKWIAQMFIKVHCIEQNATQFSVQIAPI